MRNVTVTRSRDQSLTSNERLNRKLETDWKRKKTMPEVPVHLKGLCHADCNCYLFITCFRTKIMVQFLFLRQYLGTETFPRRLLYVWQRWKWIENLKTLTQLFRVLLLCLQKSATNYYGQCSPIKFVWYRLHNSTGEFYVWVKALINDMSLAKNWPKTAISSWHSSI